MSCGKPHKAYVAQLSFATQLAVGQGDAAPRCRNPKCNLPLKKDGTCPRGCRQEDAAPVVAPADVGAFLDTPAMQDAVLIHHDPAATRPQLERAQAMYRQELQLAQQPGNESWLPLAQDALFDLQTRLDWLDVEDTAEVFVASQAILRAVAEETSGVPVLQAAETLIASSLARNVGVPFWTGLHNFEPTHRSPQRRLQYRLPEGALSKLGEYKHQVGEFLAGVPPEGRSEVLADLRLTAAGQQILRENEAEWQLFCRGEGGFARGVLYTERRRPDGTTDPLPTQEFLADTAAVRGDYARVRAGYEQLLSSYEQTGDLAGQARMQAALGGVALASGEGPDRATAYTDKAMGLAWAARNEQGERVGDAARAAVEMVQGAVAMHRGDYYFARDRWEMALENYRAAGDRWGESQALWSLAQVSETRGDAAQAIADYGAAAAAMAAVDNTIGEAGCREAQGRLAWQAGEFNRARGYLNMGLAVCESLPDDSMAAGFRRQLAGVAAAMGDRAGAAFNLREAAAALRRIGKETTAQQVEQELAQLEQRPTG